MVISTYIALRFEWKFAVPVLIALMHDILIMAGVYALVGREVTTSTVAALLTILGYSLYDTIIVFDRVRENVPRMPSAAFSQIVNRSMSRGHHALAGDELLHAAAGPVAVALRRRDAQDFAFALFVGIASGTYSSIFIADAGARALEGARAGLRRARARASGRAGRRARVRDDARRAAGRRRPERARAPRAGDHRAAGSGAGLAGRVRRHGRRPRHRGGPRSASARRRGRRRRADRGRGADAAAAVAPPPPARARRRPGPAPTRRRAAAATKPKRRAPQAREAPLMGMLVWVMTGLALWHFTIWLPDRFWGGIVGAFLGALFGSSSSACSSTSSRSRQHDTHLLTALEAIPGA